MTDLKMAVMAVFGIALLSLVILILVMALDAANDVHEFFSFMTTMLFVAACLFGVLGQAKGITKTQDLYRTKTSGLVAVSIFPLSVIVSTSTSQALLQIVARIIT